jgi:hypothetical protein
MKKDKHPGDWHKDYCCQKQCSCGTYYDIDHCPKCGSTTQGSPQRIHTIEVTCLDCNEKWWHINDIECPKCGRKKTTFLKDWEKKHGT